MSLIRWTPFLEPLVGDEFDKFFDWPTANLTASFSPAVDIYQDDDQVVVETPMTGIDPEKVDINVKNDILTIKGESEKKSEVEDKDYYRQEIRRGSFYRSVQLPAQVVGEKASAEYKNGILKITLPKAPESKTKSIKVEVK
ncbi:MAG: hypothetical protein A3B89_01030 [Candidatus Buchananbacteria bacterium RIFCSPHIGHO2_02_FULL_40_13]|uniref:Uncharacterized protein n=1 Tax=Candidatus Buchananbacteria bacterium RIFCSPLOWO2_01_FULL_39_33 TaxID=1797543 RepID=A0A1G1YGW1_9BACT|nr:MAG: hypothetical protein A2820_01100 [Candidatus Buchananbacteria bacterium RIFCSPHIGHO2_01_FULL_40_35]OGY50455.1 MAG: hypothetical protein A3B89_01030 [Candidatus Buchananbacteria bacterium RIFCSPHIGHO2_02_FULL_40_13]OGY51595.1 MAG: hypothetical protein A3A02_02185 [Candidatus Buchananbacteria bacterium RIFCSPLOWO2_01_FULL_39_33]